MDNRGKEQGGHGFALQLVPDVKCLVPSQSPSTFVRRATQSDTSALVDLMFEFYSEANYPLDTEWARAAFSRLLDNSDLGCIWIAEVENAPAGHVVLTLRYTMEHGSLSGYIDDLFVRPEFRRRGIGHALVSKLVEECERRGCKSIYVEVGDTNAPAIGLYSRLGLERFQDGRVLFGSTLRAVGT